MTRFEVPASNMKKAICQILVDEGYVKNYTVTEDGKQGVIKVTPSSTARASTLSSRACAALSKPGLRIYSSAAELPKVMKGLGMAIISTSRGVMTDREARKKTSAARFWRSFGNQGGCKHVANWKKTHKYSRWRDCHG